MPIDNITLTFGKLDGSTTSKILEGISGLLDVRLPRGDSPNLPLSFKITVSSLSNADEIAFRDTVCKHGLSKETGCAQAQSLKGTAHQRIKERRYPEALALLATASFVFGTPSTVGSKLSLELHEAIAATHEKLGHSQPRLQAVNDAIGEAKKLGYAAGSSEERACTSRRGKIRGMWGWL